MTRQPHAPLPGGPRPMMRQHRPHGYRMAHSARYDHIRYIAMLALECVVLAGFVAVVIIAMSVL